MRHGAALVGTLAVCAVLGSVPVRAAAPDNAGWFAAWTASAHGPYPVGNPTAQPELKFALPSADAGANDQTFRMIVRPDVWGTGARIRLSNAFGTKPVTFDGAYIGLQSTGAVLVPGTDRPVTFGGKKQVTVAPGQTVLSDTVALPWAKPADPMMANRKLAVSFHVVGADRQADMARQGADHVLPVRSRHGVARQRRRRARISLLHHVLVLLGRGRYARARQKTVVAMGDSITDGTASTLNGDDRWPDVFSRRLHAAFGSRYSVVNEGIGGNMVSGPAGLCAKPVRRRPGHGRTAGARCDLLAERIHRHLAGGHQ